jgi:hypothetical protein
VAITLDVLKRIEDARWHARKTLERLLSRYGILPSILARYGILPTYDIPYMLGVCGSGSPMLRDWNAIATLYAGYAVTIQQIYQTEGAPSSDDEILAEVTELCRESCPALARDGAFGERILRALNPVVSTDDPQSTASEGESLKRLAVQVPPRNSTEISFPVEGGTPTLDSPVGQSEGPATNGNQAPKSEPGGNSGPHRRRGRPTEIPDSLKDQALAVKGGKARAAILYKTKYPSSQQVKNVSSILKHFQKSEVKG